MAKDIWSGNEPFLRGHEKKKDKKLAARVIIGLAVVFVVVFSISALRQEYVVEVGPDPVEQPDDLIEYRNLSAQELLDQLNEEKGFDDNIKEVEMVARKYIFEPNIVEAELGQTIKLNIRSVDVNHSIRIPAFFIEESIPAGEDIVVEFAASKKGEFAFSSPDNEEMSGKIVII